MWTGTLTRDPAPHILLRSYLFYDGNQYPMWWRSISNSLDTYSFIDPPWVSKYAVYKCLRNDMRYSVTPLWMSSYSPCRKVRLPNHSRFRDTNHVTSLTFFRPLWLLVEHYEPLLIVYFCSFKRTDRDFKRNQPSRKEGSLVCSHDVDVDRQTVWTFLLDKSRPRPSVTVRPVTVCTTVSKKR